MKINARTTLIIIFVVVIALRLWVAFSVPGLSSDESYWHVRNVESISETGKPLFEDNLAWGGHTVPFSPLFDYIVALFSFAMPMMVALKLIPTIFAALLIFVVYLLTKRITKNEPVAIFTALISAIIPVWLQETINQLTPLSLVVPLIGFLIYALSRMEEKNWLYTYVIGLAFAAFLHPLSLLVALTLVVYLVVTYIERIKVDRAMLEVSIFSIFFVLWAQFLLYKKLFFLHGLSLIWQNIPSALVSESFARVSVLGAITQVGIVPVLTAAYLTYRYVFKVKYKELSLIISLVLSVGLLLAFKFVQPQIGLVLLGMSAIPLFGYSLALFIPYVNHTKAARWKTQVILLVCLFAILSKAWPAALAMQHTLEQFPQEEQDAMRWLATHTSPDVVVVGLTEEGQRINAIAKRQTLTGERFIGRTDATERTDDLKRMFTTTVELEAVELFDKYDIDYIYYSPKAQEKYSTDVLPYGNERCFPLVYNEGVKIYEKSPKCKVRDI